jgi:hypothetical protein
MEEYQPYKYVSLQQAYGGFKSDKQRRYFFAALKDGRIQVPYKRTQTLRRRWQIIGNGRNTIIANETPYAQYVMGDNTQSRMHNLIGWKTLATRLKEHREKLEKVMYAAVKKTIHKLGL